MEFERMDWCPGCGWRRFKPIDTSEFDRDAREAVAVALFKDERENPCCNPACQGTWGTGCWHCHHPSYASRVRGVRSVARRSLKKRNRRAREQHRTAPRGQHFDLDTLATKADRAEADRERLPSLPRWQRGEWRHIVQRIESGHGTRIKDALRTVARIAELLAQDGQGP